MSIDTTNRNTFAKTVSQVNADFINRPQTSQAKPRGAIMAQMFKTDKELHSENMPIKDGKLNINFIQNLMKDVITKENVKKPFIRILYCLLKENREVLKVENKRKEKSKHFTEITLSKLSQNAPSIMQIDKI